MITQTIIERGKPMKTTWKEEIHDILLSVTCDVMRGPHPKDQWETVHKYEPMILEILLTAQQEERKRILERVESLIRPVDNYKLKDGDLDAHVSVGFNGGLIAVKSIVEEEHEKSK
jgi:hypothetical protein